MPIRRLVKIGEMRVHDVEAQQIIERLVHEWTSSVPLDVFGPSITEQRDPHSGAVHLYVVWDRFRGIGHQQRSEMIMDAYQQVAPADVRNVTLAMGLTAPEVERMGLDL
ncbi:MAG: hypothetical protein ABMA64_11845 [Myxococcota bacterium]